jgi:hypothetical protein
MPRAQDPNEGIGQAQANDLERNSQYGNYIPRATTLGLGASTVPQARAGVRYMQPDMQLGKGNIIPNAYDINTENILQQQKKKPDVIWGNPDTSANNTNPQINPQVGGAAAAAPPAAAPAAQETAEQRARRMNRGRGPFDGPRIPIPGTTDPSGRKTPVTGDMEDPTDDEELDDIFDQSGAGTSDSDVASAGSAVGGGVGLGAAASAANVTAGGPPIVKDPNIPGRDPDPNPTGWLPRQSQQGSKVPVGSKIALGPVGGASAAAPGTVGAIRLSGGTTPTSPRVTPGSTGGPAIPGTVGNIRLLPTDDDILTDNRPREVAPPQQPNWFSRMGSAIRGAFTRGPRPGEAPTIPSENELMYGRAGYDSI